MKADLILCDHAEAVNGKLYINGGGWNILFAAGRLATFYLAILVEVDWDETNIRHHLQIELRTADGDLVQVDGSDIAIPAGLELGRPPGVKAGSSLLAPLAIAIQGIPLDEGGYVWHVNAAEQELARRVFQVVAPPTLPGFPPPG